MYAVWINSQNTREVGPGFAVVLRSLRGYAAKGRTFTPPPPGGPRNFPRKGRPGGAPAHPKARPPAWKKNVDPF